jgi:chromosome segregation ATPase
MLAAELGNGGGRVMSAAMAEVCMEGESVGRLEPRVARIESDVANLKETVDRLDKKVDRLEDKVDQRFDKVDERFDKVDQRFDKLDERFDEVDQRFEKIDERFLTLDSDVNNLDKTMAVMERGSQDVRETQGRLHIELQHLRSSLDAKFLWIVTTMIAFGTALLAAMAKGFHWLK